MPPFGRNRYRYRDQPPVPFEELKRRALRALAQTSRDWLTVSAIGQACWPAEPDEWPRRFRTTQGYAFAAGKVVSVLLADGLIAGFDFGYRITQAGRLALEKLGRPAADEAAEAAPRPLSRGRRLPASRA